MTHRFFMCCRAFAPALRLGRAFFRCCLLGRFGLRRAGFGPARRTWRAGRWRSRLTQTHIRRRRSGASGRGLLLRRDALAPLLGTAPALRVVERRLFPCQAVQRATPLGFRAIDAAGEGERPLALRHRGIVAGLSRRTFGRQLLASLRILERSIGGACGERRQAAHEEQDPKSHRHVSGDRRLDGAPVQRQVGR
ncbi:MAG TPA: hypothetical protein VEX14_14850 [Burkholderiaceae bacterium]|nr:hypothetical protein [Burkholderiaceae bacterium]